MDLDRCSTPPTGDDAATIGRVTDPMLRRLIRTAIGLSEDSLDLLTMMSARLRAVEGMTLRDPLDE
ncbi:hypothetical protein [Nocardia callitridis]|uniref:Uncharacterized protein n=1 Tax=Nocardia callitridis TaxID=648753 RepID=A0ABP9L741_9NOCA